MKNIIKAIRIHRKDEKIDKIQTRNKELEQHINDRVQANQNA